MNTFNPNLLVVFHFHNGQATSTNTAPRLLKFASGFAIIWDYLWQLFQPEAIVYVDRWQKGAFLYVFVKNVWNSIQTASTDLQIFERTLSERFTATLDFNFFSNLETWKA